ncbi:MAG: hypothetical protein LCI00_10040 [Chloroflexi bacterium]|nr:hypothetical protein [Chloroflexota bacterium]MCC6892933.1 hypothetical protein [Anaerolineae bacterium]
MVPSFLNKWRTANVSPEVIAPIRNALWEDDGLREAFMSENPARLSTDDLALNDTYRDIQERGGIITNLSPSNGNTNNQERIRLSNQEGNYCFSKGTRRIWLKPKHDSRAD